MKKFALLSLFVFALSAMAAGAQTSLFPDQARLASLQNEPNWGGLHSSCISDLKLQGHPVADYSPLPHYDANGPRKESDNDAVPSLRRDSIAIYQLSLCFELSKDPAYSAKAEELLNGWAHTTKRIGTEQGKDGFNFFFPYALAGAYFLRRDAGWSGADLDRFVRDLVIPANNMSRENNHGNWGVLLMASAGGYLNDATILQQTRQRWLELMRSQVAADGSMPLEICRSDTSNWCGGPTKGIKGMAYTHYALEPITLAAEIFQNEGVSIYNTQEKQLLCKAYARAADWTLHPETFPYYKANDGKLIGLYSVDYFYILQQHCPNPEAAEVLRKYGPKAADPWKIREMYSR